jgi:hypothetical protein
MYKFLAWHQEYCEWFKEKTGISDYGVYWISFMKGLVIGMVVCMMLS